MRTQAQLEALTQEVLGDDHLELSISKYTLTEDIEAGTAWIVCQLAVVDHGPPRAVEGKGVGFIDALFNGLKATLVGDYPSVGHIHFVGFEVGGDFNNATDGARSDAPGTVKLVIENSSGREFTFTATSPSVSASSVNVVLRAVEHFVNAERAVLAVYDWIEDARKRSRPDLAERYTQRLAELVQNASYSDTIERKRAAVST